MSSAFYPISLISKLVVTPYARVLADEFESGDTATRATWPAQYFKRQFAVTHAPLTSNEWRYLRSFHAARNGMFDSFWFRDNVNREGNALVRFSQDFPRQFQGGARQIQLSLQEVSAVRVLPELEEVSTAAGTTPLLWLDANRELYYLHAGSTVTEGLVWDETRAYRPIWQVGGLSLGGTAAQNQFYQFTGTNWAQSGTIAGLTGTQPAITLFCLAKHGTISGKEVLASVGTAGSGKAFGLAVAADNYYEPWIGASETWTAARKQNSAINTWRSFAVTAAASSNSVTLYANGASVGSDTNTRSYSAGALALGAAVDGNLKASATANAANVLIFPAALTLAQVKALHNLFAYQFGLAMV